MGSRDLSVILSSELEDMYVGFSVFFAKEFFGATYALFSLLSDRNVNNITIHNEL